MLGRKNEMKMVREDNDRKNGMDKVHYLSEIEYVLHVLCWEMVSS